MSDNSDSSKSEKIQRLERINISAKVLLSHGKMFRVFADLSEEGVSSRHRPLHQWVLPWIFPLRQVGLRETSA